MFNRYWYANGNPFRFYDPDGRMSGLVELFKAFVGMPSSGDGGPKQEPTKLAAQVGQQVKEGAKKAKEGVKAVRHEAAKVGDKVSLGADAVAIATVELPPVSIAAETVSTTAAVTAAVAEPTPKRLANILSSCLASRSARDSPRRSQVK